MSPLYTQAIRDNGRARVEQWLDSLRSAERSHVDLGKRYFPYIGKANALHLAVWYNKEDIAKLLIEYGAGACSCTNIHKFNVVSYEQPRPKLIVLYAFASKSGVIEPFYPCRSKLCDQ